MRSRRPIATLLALGCLPSIFFAQSPSGQHAAAGKAVEQQAEKDWADARWNQTDVGPFLASNFQMPGGAIAKALSIRVGDNGEAAVCYDTGKPGLRAAWTGGFLKFDGRRFGLLSAPTAAGDLIFAARGNCGWQGTEAHHEALRLGGHRVVIETRVGDTLVRESPWFEKSGGVGVFTRDFEIAPGTKSLTQKILSEPKSKFEVHKMGAVTIASVEQGGKMVAFALGENSKASLAADGGDVSLTFAPRTEMVRAKLIIWSGTSDKLGDFEKAVRAMTPAADLAELSKPGPGRWLPAITNAGRIGFPADGFAVDTITVPYANPWKALMFCSGVDFFSDGSAAVCTIHGDVWRVSGLDDKLRAVTWRRFATGLFQPLGLRVVNDHVHVLGRDQITVLHDENSDNEADRYENFFNSIETTEGHNYVTCLERDTAGNFYYCDPAGAHRISPDGKATETLATGLRNPNGLGVGPGPIITVSPQQGEWTPSSVIFEVTRGAHYGYRGPKVTPARPLGYDAPLCWLPHGFDNSSGSQVWVPPNAWGALGGHMLHLLWGRCSMALVLRDVVDGQPQGAAVALPGKFLSGPMRGTFSPKDGQLYIAGSTGWQTSAAKDGSLQRVRRTGTVIRTPIAWHAHRNGLKLTFAEPLEKSAAEDPGSYAIHQWNYRYTASYGSKDYSVADPNKEGRDEVTVRSAKVLPDGKSVFIETAELKPVMQMELKYNLQFAGGATAASPLYLTLNRLAAPMR